MFACLFFSTVSSSINALVAVTVEDFIFPIFKDLTPKQVTWMNMGLSKLCGGKKQLKIENGRGARFCNLQEKWSGEILLKQKTLSEMGVKIQKYHMI